MIASRPRTSGVCAASRIHREFFIKAIDLAVPRRHDDRILPTVYNLRSSRRGGDEIPWLARAHPQPGRAAPPGRLGATCMPLASAPAANPGRGNPRGGNMTGGQQGPSARTASRRVRMGVPHAGMPVRGASRPRIHEACDLGWRHSGGAPGQASTTATTPWSWRSR